jgi:hypothetical protein
MGKVVHRVDTPGIAGPVMMGMFDTVHDRVAQLHIGAAISTLARSTFSPSGIYPPASRGTNEGSLHAPAAEGLSLPGSVGVPFNSGDLFGAAVVYISQPLRIRSSAKSYNCSK